MISSAFSPFFYLLWLFRRFSTLQRMASLAGYLRYLADRKLFDIKKIVQKYEEWVLEDRYMVLAHEREDLQKEQINACYAEWEQYKQYD